MTRILTIGTEEIDFSRTINVTDTILNKPDFNSNVLWGSTMIKYPGNKIGSSWKNFTSGEFISKDYRYGVSFTLNRNSRILEIKDLDSYIRVMKIYSYKKYENDNRKTLDFVKISKDYDAFHLTEEAFWQLRMPVGVLYALDYCDFYSYDAESWAIFNLNAINKGSILNHNNVFGYWEVNGYDND